MRYLSLFCISCFLFSCANKERSDANTASALQRLEVVAALDDIHGTLFMETSDGDTNHWVRLDSFPVVLGKNGLALPKEKEGDGHSPVGSYPLGMGFCYTDPGGFSYPVVVVDTNDICVDDVYSDHYNTYIRKDTIDPLPASFEYLHRKDALYTYGIWVLYNADPPKAGDGSCIFLHVWKGPDAPTSGCTAMDSVNMLRLLHWLDPEKHPVLYQHMQ